MIVWRSFSPHPALVLLSTLAAFTFATTAGPGTVRAQISGTLGGDLAAPVSVPSDAVVVTKGELENALIDGTSNTIVFASTPLLNNVLVSGYSAAFEGPRRVRLAADVAAPDGAGGTRTTRIIAILIALLVPRAPGFADYADNDCVLTSGEAPRDMELAACSAVAHAFRAAVRERRLSVAPRAVMAQTPDGLAVWAPR